MDNILDPTVIAVAVVSVIIIFAILVCVLSRGKKRTTVAIVGLCDSGKTLLHYRLLYGQFKKTYSSINENTGKYIIQGKTRSLDLVDVPGHERVRQGVLMKYAPSLKGLIILIDSVNFPKECIDVAGMLYDMFSNKTLMSMRMPILIACNKQDVSLAKDCSFVKDELTREINRLRTSRSAALEGTSGGPMKQLFVGKKNKEFEFSDLPCSVKFVSCSARGSGTDEESSQAEVDQVEDWIEKLA